MLSILYNSCGVIVSEKRIALSHAVWLYFRFALSFRDVEETMAMRGVTLTYETIREWCLKFGQTFANELRRRRPQPGDK